MGSDHHAVVDHHRDVASHTARSPGCSAPGKASPLHRSWVDGALGVMRRDALGRAVPPPTPGGAQNRPARNSRPVGFELIAYTYVLNLTSLPSRWRIRHHPPSRMAIRHREWQPTVVRPARHVIRYEATPPPVTEPGAMATANPSAPAPSRSEQPRPFPSTPGWRVNRR